MNAFEEAAADLATRKIPKVIKPRVIPKSERINSISVYEWLLLNGTKEREAIADHFLLPKNVISAMLAHLMLHGKVKSNKEFSYIVNKDVQFYTAILSPDGDSK